MWAEGYLGEITNILNVQERTNRYILIPISIWQSISFYSNQNNFHLTAFHDQVTNKDSKKDSAVGEDKGLKVHHRVGEVTYRGELSKFPP